ncbi:MAG: GNAT family N-acetyltransferase [Acidimicrobiales bacterium]|nr:GNAT family N-acetyltransferase [Acidimicrobiales bacterium]
MTATEFRPPSPQTSLLGRRVLLRTLRADDFPQWSAVRRRNREWLTVWEPSTPPEAPDLTADRSAFALRCHSRDRSWQMGTGFGFGIFVGGHFVGEINLNSVQRGAFQNAYLGYWVDQDRAGNGYVPESVVLAFQFAFERANLHRVQIAIVPRNVRSLRVVEKLGLRHEGVAERYLEINGVWEDHARFAITAEDWEERGPELTAAWL